MKIITNDNNVKEIIVSPGREDVLAYKTFIFCKQLEDNRLVLL